MKTNLLFIPVLLVIGITGTVKSQSLFSNPGFEEWDTLSTHNDPRGWHTLNELTQFGLPATTLITADAHSGNYAVMLRSESGSTTDLTGIICTGPILNSSGSADFSKTKKAFTGRPVSVRFYYKSYPMAGDTCAVYLLLTRWNAAAQRNDTIGLASFGQGDSVTTYTLANVPVEYNSPLPPDSAYLIATSSLDGFNPTPGTVFYLDDLELVYSTGLESEMQKQTVQTYPNPISDKLNINVNADGKSEIVITSITGQLIHTETFVGKTQLDVSLWENGVYIMTCVTNGRIQYQKLIKQ